MDLIQWLAGSKCAQVTSFGRVSFFRPDNAPAGAADNCMEDCPHVGTCPYDAHLYLSSENRWLQYIRPNLAEGPGDLAQTLSWLQQSPWSRCVYKCQNTAVDHQVVAMQFFNGITATFTMTAFAKGRSLEIYGTKGCLRGGESFRQSFGCDLVMSPHAGGGEERISVDFHDIGYVGHGGGDYGLMNELYAQMTAPVRPTDSHYIQDSTESHRMAFAAHASRLNGGIPICPDGRRVDHILPIRGHERVER
jgi:predicted dehydrogenase